MDNNYDKNTLGFYYETCRKMFGKDSYSASYINDIIKKSPKGIKEKVPGDFNKSLKFLLKIR